MVFMVFGGFSNVLGSSCVIFIGFSNVLGSLIVIFGGFSNVSVFWKPKTLAKKTIKTIKTIIFKLSPDGGVALGDNWKIMVCMVFGGFSNVLGSSCVIFIGFSNVLGSLCVIFIGFSNVLGSLCVSFFIGFSNVLGSSCVIFYWFFQCFGLLVCHFYGFWDVCNVQPTPPRNTTNAFLASSTLLHYFMSCIDVF